LNTDVGKNKSLYLNIGQKDYPEMMNTELMQAWQQ
jgi:hypothetical protein